MSSVTAKQTGYPLPQRNLSLKTRRQSLKISLLIATAVLLMGVLFLSYIHLLNKATALNYRTHNAARSLDQLEREVKEYELEAFKLRSLERIEETSIKKLGMVPPKSVLLESVIEYKKEQEKAPPM
jgi:cell division protein FtsL